jgi:thymidylate synthase (FAD)
MHLKVELITYTPNPDNVISLAGKLCYSPVGINELQEKLTENQINKFVNQLIEIGHESPIEHVDFTFGIEDVSRALTHQLVRHRIASYSQQSQRYVKLDHFEYVVPPSIEKNPEAKETFIKAMETDQKAYDWITMLIEDDFAREYFDSIGINYKMVNCPPYSHLLYLAENSKEMKSKASEIEKKAIEDARYVFPNACETKIMVTMNARSLMNFFAHRCCTRTQWEIRDLANKMLKLVKEVSPILFKNAGANCTQLGYCPEGKMSCHRYKTLKELKGK